MDLLAACQAFVCVADRGSFTRGAAWAGVSQSVASRRVASLERRLGGPLLARSGRAPTLTALGRRVLPPARALVEAAEALLVEADGSALTAVRLAVPPGGDVRDAAAVELAGRDSGTALVVVEAGVRVRPGMAVAGKVDAAVVAVPAPDATWCVPLGVAAALPGDGRIHLDRLRPGRGDRGRPLRRVWLLPEDDVPHVRDPLVAAAELAGLAPTQVAVASSSAAALANVLASEDLVVLSRAEAGRFDLGWQPLAAPVLVRGHALASSASSDAAQLGPGVSDALARLLGADGGT